MLSGSGAGCLDILAIVAHIATIAPAPFNQGPIRPRLNPGIIRTNLSSTKVIVFGTILSVWVLIIRIIVLRIRVEKMFRTVCSSLKSCAPPSDYSIHRSVLAGAGARVVLAGAVPHAPLASALSLSLYICVYDHMCILSTAAQQYGVLSPESCTIEEQF